MIVKDTCGDEVFRQMNLRLSILASTTLSAVSSPRAGLFVFDPGLELAILLTQLIDEPLVQYNDLSCLF